MRRRTSKDKIRSNGESGGKKGSFRRAIWDDDKVLRRDSILESASRLFEMRDFDEISVQDICKGAGLAKGTFYLYFPTKEAAYLSLEMHQIDGWIKDLEVGIGALAGLESSVRLTDVFVASIAVRPQMPRYLSILHNVLERNVREDHIVELKLFLKEVLERGARLLAQRVNGLSDASAMEVLLFFHTIIIGGWQMANPPPVVRKVLVKMGLAEFDIKFEDLVHRQLSTYLKGLLSR